MPRSARKHFAGEARRIQPADVQELIKHGASAVVLSKGMWERLQVCPKTVEVLDKNGIQIEVLQTEDAVERFNELREDMPVGGLFHSLSASKSSTLGLVEDWLSFSCIIRPER